MKYKLSIYSIILGMLIGLSVSAIFFILYINHMEDMKNVKATFQITEYSDLSSKIYKTGELNSTKIILNFLKDKIKHYKNEVVTEDSTKSHLKTDLGLTHARLFLIYKKAGQEDLAKKEYNKAKNILLKKGYNIKSKDDLINLIQNIDQS